VISVARCAEKAPKEALSFMSESSIAAAETTLPTSPIDENPALEASVESETVHAAVTEPEAPTSPVGDPIGDPGYAPVDPKVDPEIDPDIVPDPSHTPEPEPESDPAPQVEPDLDPQHAPVREPDAANETASPASAAAGIEMAAEIPAEAPPEVAALPTPPPATPVAVANPVTATKPVPVAQPVQEVEPEPEESFADIFSEFQRTNQRREPGASQIRGTIVSVTSDSVLVDIGFKSEGILPLTAFPKVQPKAGDALQVSVKGRDEDGYYQLSLFRTAVPKDWSSLERAFEQKATIVGTVTAVVKGGLHVDCGVRAFLPASRSGARDAAEMEKLIGQEIRVRITKLDVADEDLVVDRRVVTEEEAVAGKAQRYAEVEEGEVVDGTVRSIMDFGAFIDLGGVDGLLHISDISWTRVTNVADVLKVGQQIEVKVLKIDHETQRIGLGLKQLQAHPWDAVVDKYALGEKVHGTVTRIADFGAFVELEPGVEGLVHLSEMSWTKRILKATEVVKVGDPVDAVILAIAVPERRISLGLKQALGDPWVKAAETLAPGTVVEGPVTTIMKFGAFVQAAEGVEGLVHISEIVADRRLNHPSDVLRVGQVVKAMVLEVDKDKRQMKLSMKQLIPTSLDEFLAEHQVGDSVTGRIVSVAEGTAQVELGEGLVCLVVLPVPKAEEPEVPAAAGKVDLSAFSSMLKTKWKTGASAGDSASKTKALQVAAAGQMRNFRITQLDVATKTVAIELIA
jgi:small subunit ribosomal protein S1